MTAPLVPVAVPVPLYGLFDYRLPAGPVPPEGARVLVPFGRRRLVGVVAGEPHEAASADIDYKPIERVIDAEALIPPQLLELARWVADYYHHPLGEVFATLLPGPLRRGAAATIARAPRLQLTPAGRSQTPPRAPVQAALMRVLAAGPADRAQLLAAVPASTAPAALRRLVERGWVTPGGTAPPPAPAPEAPAPALTADQQQAVSALSVAAGAFGVYLLQGVTGSGKTEVYLQAMAQALARGGQVLALVPEIGLTPQLLERVRARFGEAAVAGFHSGLSETERAQVWLRARAGEVAVVVGTRSAVFLPFARLGLAIVDEEHDASFKQQEGLRYSARDLAVLRGSRERAPVILGSATPSLETLQRAESGRYARLRLPQRVQARAPPALQLLDVRGQALHHGLSPPLIAALRRHLHEHGQVLLFINRRGYAPALLCHACGWTAPCPQCDARLTVHRGRGRLICHHCGRQQAPPPRCMQCGSAQLMPVGQGTERVEEALRTLFPQARCERFDSDRLRSQRALEALLRDTREGRVDVLIGTQMLAKGHDFAGLSLVAIVDADQALYSIDFRALERMGQLLTQVAGRAGRAEPRGEVLVQTHQPEHPALRRLVEEGYEALAQQQLAERRRAGLPPYAHLALLRAEGRTEVAALRFLSRAAAALGAPAGVAVLGPVPAPMERRAGRWRAQLLLQAASRSALQRALAGWVPQLGALPEARGLRWSIDVDPVDLY